MTCGKYKLPREIGVYKELINDVKLIKLIAMGDCATRNQARTKLELNTIVGGGNEYITKQEAIDLGADSIPLDKYIGPKELVSIDDIVIAAYRGTKFLTLYNVPEVATNYFQTTIYFDIYDDEGFILSDYIEIGRDEIDPNEPDLTTTEVLNIPKGRENTKATLKITGILVAHDGYYLAKLPKMYIMGYEGPIAELYDVTTEINEPLTVPFLYPGDQRLVGFEIDFKEYNVLGEITLFAYDFEEVCGENPNMELRLNITMDLVNDNNDKFTVNSEVHIGYETATGETLYKSVTKFSVPKDFENATGNITINSIYITTDGFPYDIPIVYMTVLADAEQLYSATDVWQGDPLDIVFPIITKGSFKKLEINCQF